jgi:hypothetical protein
MITAIASANHTDPTAASASQARPAAKPPAQSQPQSATSAATDTVSISSAARALQQESLETPAQTAKEAGGGDQQAQRLLVKEAAARKTE